MAKIPALDHTTVSAAAAALVLANATEVKDGNAPPWRPDGEYAPRVVVDIIRSRNAISGPQNSDQRFSHLQPIIHTNIGLE